MLELLSTPPEVDMSLSFTPCHCKGGTYNRVPRSLWMHFFPTRRLYLCSECDHRALAVKKDMEATKWAVTTGAFNIPSARTYSPHKPTNDNHI